MSVAVWVALVIGGGVGAGVRYVVDAATPKPRGFPLGILIVNVVGSLLLGLVAGLGAAVFDPTWALVLGTGLVGGFTTFSTVSVESAMLAQRRMWLLAVANLVGTLVAAVAAAGLGWVLGALLVG
ncbi:hypothetical protein GCM10022200_19270 [Microbacterium awajiense]|uniref:Fluoride-specific ion channel FluC n=1 Tax=Microbacterium awajiense TaxID=415214 RepID=A0ABP7AN08_9MICO